MDGVLYRSYDNYAGDHGFYQPGQDNRPMSPQRARPPSRGGLEAAPPLMMPLMRPMSPNAAGMPNSPTGFPGFASPGFTSPRLAPQMMAAPIEPMRAAEIRGVGIKFGERLDPSGAIKVYVKRIVQDGPAHNAGNITPGDVLVTVQGANVQGSGLDTLRTQIPGPANSFVCLGLVGAAGYYEATLPRTAVNLGECIHECEEPRCNSIAAMSPRPS